MGLWKRSAAPPPAESTMGVTQSQILSVTPARMPEPPTPTRRRRPSELSLWGGNVLAADDFAPDAKRGARRGGRVALVVVVGALLAAGGWVWHSWPNLPWVGQFAFAPKPAQPIVSAPAAKPAPAPTVAAPAPAEVAPAPTVAAATPVEAAPSEPAPIPKAAHNAKPAKLASNKHHHHHSSSRTKKHSHAKPIRSSAPTDG